MSSDFLTEEIEDKAVVSKSNRLKGKTIALGICGGIASFESIKLARELRRHKAEVYAFLTPDTQKFMTPLALEWATNHAVTYELSSAAEHLLSFDFSILAPLTLNTLSKLALAISDNALTLMMASHIGRKSPFLMVPTMNLAMAQHPLYSEYLKTLVAWGGKVLTNPPEEGRLKYPDVLQITEETLKFLS